jgi:hypothetical protein
VIAFSIREQAEELVFTVVWLLGEQYSD